MLYIAHNPYMLLYGLKMLLYGLYALSACVCDVKVKMPLYASKWLTTHIKAYRII